MADVTALTDYFELFTIYGKGSDDVAASTIGYNDNSTFIAPHFAGMRVI
jgi:hypothetical protein